MFRFGTFFVLFLSLIVLTSAGTKSKPHSHSGLLTPYDGKHIPYEISLEQNRKLDAGEPVVINERSGKDGRGIVLQDVNASPKVCMDRIRDLVNYSKMVPKVKSVIPYEETQFPNGTVKTGAEFNVGLSLLSFSYFLQLTFEPKFNTLTWTLDYRYNSDLDDNTGHWQVMPHPTKEGWTRILYSTEVKLLPWIPEFVISYLTKTALVESTTWVKKESEKIASKADSNKELSQFMDLSPCFVTTETTAKYITSCVEGGLDKSEL